MLTEVLAYGCDVAILLGFFLMNKNQKWLPLYNSINIVTNLILVPYALSKGAGANAALGIAFFCISVYGLIKSRAWYVNSSLYVRRSLRSTSHSSE